MDPADTQHRREEAREAALAFLSQRSLLAHSVEAMRRGINREGADFTMEETRAALVFLVSDGLVNLLNHPLGATARYQITAQGSRRHERSQNYNSGND